MPPRAEDAIRVAQRLGFREVRQRGSHKRFNHEDGRKLTIPYHKGTELRIGVFHEILKALGITEEEFNRLNR